MKKSVALFLDNSTELTAAINETEKIREMSTFEK